MLNKTEFLNKFGKDFKGNDIDGYVYKEVTMTFEELKKISNELISSMSQLSKILEQSDNEVMLELNNLIMNYLFGNGNAFQGSFEDESNSGDFCWCLDFGNIEVNFKAEMISYSGVKFYRG